MQNNIIIRPEAEQDMSEAFDWYEDKREGLGNDFLSQIRSGMIAISQNPQICQPVHKTTRKYIVKRFPYKIIYLVADTTIIVLGIIHGKGILILLGEGLIRYKYLLVCRR